MGKEVIKNVQEPSVKNQYLATAAVNLLMLCYGVTSGFSSPAIIFLTSDDSPLPTGKITMEQASWIASLLCIGGLIGNVLYGIITSKYGRKLPLMSMATLTILAWLLVYFAQNVYYLYASRLINGFVGGGAYTIIPIYLSEIAIDRVRGMLGSTMVFTGNIGILIVFFFGNYSDFFMAPKFVIIVAILFVISFSYFPETPSFLIKQNKIAEAENSIRFYQNLSGHDEEYNLLESEITKLKGTVGNGETKKCDDNSFKWSDLTTNPGKKAMIIGMVLASLNQLCGCFAMLQYTASIFKDAGSNMSPNMSAIVVGVIQLFGSYAPTYLVERAGRKLLFAISTIGISLGLSVLGMYTLLKSSGYNVEPFNFIPVASFSFVIFIASWAVLTLPFLVIAEIMPEKLKDFGSSFCNGLLWVCAFLVIKYLPLLTDLLGFHGTMFSFAGVCLASAAFIVLYMPETKGKSYDEIMRALQ